MSYPSYWTMADVNVFLETHPKAKWAIGGTLLMVAWWTFSIIYNLAFSPLAKYPGPKLWAISKIPYQLCIMRGQSHRRMTDLHNKHGPILRVGPNELSFNSPQAFTDIYKARPGRPQYAKDPNFYGSILNPVRGSIVGSLDDKNHTRHRRLWANAFSERALRQNEDIIRHYADMLSTRLRENTDKGEKNEYKTDIKEWFNYIAFDVTGDLLFAETFDCLKEGRLHPWIALIFAFVKGITFAGVINQFWILRMAQEWFLPEVLRQQMLKHFDLATQKTERRLEKGTTRHDFVSTVLKQGLVDEDDKFIEDQTTLSKEELNADCAFITIAGSETSATTLSGCVYFLSKNPETLKKLYEEISSECPTDSDIVASKCVHMKYLNGVIEETLRLYPPVASSLPRLVPKGGDLIDGNPVPEKTVVSTHHYASYHADANFALAEDFLPERWLGTDARFDADKRAVLQPFSLGQRGCLGKNLAYAETRLILAKLVFNFDIQLEAPSQNWIQQEMYVNWDKPPLLVTLKDRLARLG